MGSISTDQVYVGRRGRFWETAVSDLYAKAAVTVENPVHFYGRIEWHRLGDIVLSDVRSTSSTINHEREHIRSNGDSLLQINFQIEGTGTVTQDGREAVTRPGEIAVYDSSRPYQMRFGGPFRQFGVDLPRALVRNRFGCSERVTARCLAGTSGPGRFLYSYVRSLILEKDEGDPLVAEHLQHNLLNLLEIALKPLEHADTPTKSPDRLATLSRVKAYIVEHLADAELSPPMVAGVHGLSLRSLYYLFEDEGTTVCRFIQDARLDQCKREIEDARMLARSVTDIALRWGFKDSAHFSRTFRKRFGTTPRECRAGARTQ